MKLMTSRKPLILAALLLPAALLALLQGPPAAAGRNPGGGVVHRIRLADFKGGRVSPPFRIMPQSSTVSVRLDPATVTRADLETARATIYSDNPDKDRRCSKEFQLSGEQFDVLLDIGNRSHYVRNLRGTDGGEKGFLTRNPNAVLIIHVHGPAR